MDCSHRNDVSIGRVEMPVWVNVLWRAKRWDGLLAMLFLLLPAQSFAQSKPAGTDSALQGKLQQMADARAAAGLGKIALYAVQLNSGRSVGIDADRPVQTASVIKLAILYEALEEIREGKARWDEPIVLKKDDAVSGSGILQFMDAPLTLTLRDVLTLMIDMSDNTTLCSHFPILMILTFFETGI